MKKNLSGINSLDPGQPQPFVRPDLGPNCLKMLSADDTTILLSLTCNSALSG